jgi:hypothetical protein
MYVKGKMRPVLGMGKGGINENSGGWIQVWYIDTL